MFMESPPQDSYEREQVEATLESLGVEVAAETHNDFICYCPFHDNTFSPAFTVAAEKGLYVCHNASCDAARGGNLNGLVRRLSGRDYLAAARLIAKKGSETKRPLDERIAAMQAQDRWPMMPQMKIDDMVDALWRDERALSYLRDERMFVDDTLRHFEAGYDYEKDMVVVPIHDKDGNPIGVNGRSVEGKRFKLSKRMPRNKVLFNMHRAKQSGGTGILCESQFDVMRIHQAGYPNAVCPMGSHISKDQAGLMMRYFDRVILMTDDDAAGNKMGHTVAAMLRGVRVEWGLYDWDSRYPGDAEDVGDMTDSEIKQVIDNSVSNITFQMNGGVA